MISLPWFVGCYVVPYLLTAVVIGWTLKDEGKGSGFFSGLFAGLFLATVWPYIWIAGVRKIWGKLWGA